MLSASSESLCISNTHLQTLLTSSPTVRKMAAMETSMLIKVGTNFDVVEPVKSPTPACFPSQHIRRFFSCKNLQFEMMRLETFRDWDNKFVKAIDLAKSGFFCLHKEDLVQCHYCKGVVGYWEEGDIPSLEHAKHYPNCPLVMGAAVTNVPMDGSEVSQLLQKFLVATLQDKHLPTRKILFQADSGRVDTFEFGSSVRRHQFPGLEDHQKREETFYEKNPNLPPKKKMAEAGFFLLGMSDMTQCFSCAGGVFNWQFSEDPVKIHDELYPGCRLSIKRGSKYTPQAEIFKRKKPVEKHEEMQLLELPLAKKLCKQGWNHEVVVGALWQELEMYGFLPVDINEATDVVADYEESMETA